MSPKDPRALPELVLEIVPVEAPKPLDKSCFVFDLPVSAPEAWKPRKAPVKPS